jgi:hypothetical protein
LPSGDEQVARIATAPGPTRPQGREDSPELDRDSEFYQEILELPKTRLLQLYKDPYAQAKRDKVKGLPTPTAFKNTLTQDQRVDALVSNFYGGDVEVLYDEIFGEE